ncbi:hypothetical protein NAT51_18955 [Flavobacterium amniphilum]|uniref:hypothetical protein n=1 Tax=Flavobacterium amniphilum TaxID=1834035 RepID=UPI00202A44F6|nr:hypothetical protein [Flavobacterium amniphilum]MCL9807609.1 hypothetical protein [Flavobacterium amniphilum]
MKTISVIFLFFLIQTFSLKAQIVDMSPEYLGVLLENQSRQNEMISQMDQNYVLNQNLVNVKQIGKFNVSDVVVKSLNYNVDVSQYGNNNTVDVYRNDLQTRQAIYQQGNNNTISDFSLYSNQRTNMNFTQMGNNLRVTNFGTNSISENMTIFQTGNVKEIIIINR